MTRFWREGHYRTNYNGTEYWVDGHWVDRDDWDRYSYDSGHEQRVFHYDLLDRLHAIDGFSSCYAEPNARCPVCDAPVFFYQNEHGSRVYFDELGPPWPKHPCTDCDDVEVGGYPHIVSFRFSDEIDDIQKAVNALGEDRQFSFRHAYGHSPWDLMVVVKRFKVKRQIFIVAKRLDAEGGRFVYFSTSNEKGMLRPGCVFAKYRSKCSYFDVKAMEPRTQSVQVYRRAADFVLELPSAK
jgi:hypothetical protein